MQNKGDANMPKHANSGSFKKGEIRGYEHRFKKGHKPWNVGLKGFNPSPETTWKKGDTEGAKHPQWKGGVQKMRNDCVYLYGGKAGLRLRRPREVYTAHYGKIRKGYVIFHKDGDMHNDRPENLEAISRAELVKRNARRKGGGDI